MFCADFVHFPDFRDVWANLATQGFRPAGQNCPLLELSTPESSYKRTAALGVGIFYFVRDTKVTDPTDMQVIGLFFNPHTPNTQMVTNNQPEKLLYFCFFRYIASCLKLLRSHFRPVSFFYCRSYRVRKLKNFENLRAFLRISRVCDPNSKIKLSWVIGIVLKSKPQWRPLIVSIWSSCVLASGKSLGRSRFFNFWHTSDC